MPTLYIKRNLITGLLTIIPLWVTWLVFRFVLGLLVKLGQPLVAGLVHAISVFSPELAAYFNSQWLLYLLALLSTLVALFLVGLLARRVVGQRILAAVESLVRRIPLAQTVYGATKQLLGSLQSKPDHVERVVLVDYPRPGIKAVGMVTRVLSEQDSGRKVATVFIPTTPNPTSGYLEVVPLDELTPTDWTLDQAMTFIISGGAVGPEQVPSRRNAELRQPPGPETTDRNQGTSPLE